jgi:8-oxo-dGTP pyrophosphatase MutT (NUDIX family)
MKTLVRLEIVGDDRVDDGWLKLARRRLRNHYADGSCSSEYVADTAYRPGIDAVAVLAWRRVAAGVEVLLRQNLRPGVDLRSRLSPPAADAHHPLPLLWELACGIPEPDEQSPERFAACGARELAEEMGLFVADEALRPLGAACYPSGGILTEMIHFFSVEVPADAEPGHRAGDGTPFEEVGALRWWPLSAALSACGRGEIADAKTELALWRLTAVCGVSPAPEPRRP